MTLSRSRLGTLAAVFVCGQFSVAQTSAAPVAPLAASQPFVVAQTGHGAPVILIPGLSSSGATYDGTVEHLKGKYECHVLTLAGFAGVPAAGSGTDTAMLRTVEYGLAAYIRTKGMQHPVMVGHSLGGFLALEFAERYPDLAGDLVIVDALPFFAGVMLQAADAASAQPVAAQMRGMIADEPQDRYEAFVKSGASTRGMVTSDADFAKLTAWGLGSDKKVVGETMYEMLATDARPGLAKIPGRVLILGTWAGYPGAKKEDVQKTFDDQYRGLRHGRVVMAGQERHFIMLDNPAWFNEQLDDFLSASTTGQHGAL